jgi:hypothetical protein
VGAHLHCEDERRRDLVYGYRRVFGELDAILDTSDFRILRASRDQFGGSDGPG